MEASVQSERRFILRELRLLPGFDEEKRGTDNVHALVDRRSDAEEGGGKGQRGFVNCCWSSAGSNIT